MDERGTRSGRGLNRMNAIDRAARSEATARSKNATQLRVFSVPANSLYGSRE